jgi:hypothetical protein
MNMMKGCDVRFLECLWLSVLIFPKSAPLKSALKVEKLLTLDTKHFHLLCPVSKSRYRFPSLRTEDC